jgi:dihydrofolate reductase
MITSIIVAVAKNGVIGKDNRLIWRLPDDMKFFKNTTMGHHVIMGRKNFESIPPTFRPFNGRTNIVVSRNIDLQIDSVDVFNDLKQSIAFAEKNHEDECFIIGGGQIYNQALEEGLVDKMYITEINQSFDGDVFFPQFDKTIWQEVNRIHHEADEKHAFSFDYVTYVKKK